MNVILQYSPLKKPSCSTEFVYFIHMPFLSLTLYNMDFWPPSKQP